MRVAFFSAKPFDQGAFEAANLEFGHDVHYYEARLTEDTVALVGGRAAVCAFVNDDLSEPVLAALAAGGTRLIALRSAGFNHVDLDAAGRLGLTVVRVPAYSPHAVAEYAVGLMLSLNRNIHRAFARAREGNFDLQGLTGFDMRGKVAGVVGTGQIGLAVARILAGFGCKLLAYDPRPNPDCLALGVENVGIDELYGRADVISLHTPLTPETRHMINARSISLMKAGVMIINTSRGAVVDTSAVIEGLKSRKIGTLGLDVYEEEEGVFFNDLSGEVLQDDQLARLLTFPNVIVTSHQGFLTREALGEIASTTLSNIADFSEGRRCPNEVHAAGAVR